MRGIKIYLIVVTILFIIALGFGVYVWSVLQSLSTDSAIEVAEPVGTSQNVGTPVSETVAEPIIIQKEDLSENQQKILETVGIEGETLRITPEMIKCAEDSVGEDRVNEIIAGDSPGPIETVKLLNCSRE